MISPFETVFVPISIFFVLSIMISFSGVLQTSGVGLLAAMFSLFCFVQAAVIDPQGFAHSAKLSGVLLLLGMVIFGFHFWSPLEGHRARSEARKRFPLASRKQIKAVAAKMVSGASVSMFSLLDGRIMLNRCQHSIWCDEDGCWKRAPTRAAHNYEAEQQRLTTAIPDAPLRLPQQAQHELCVHLFFNWSIAGHQFDGERMTVALERRGEMKTKQYTCSQN